MDFIQINKTSKEALYLQIKNSIKIAIMNGTIKHMHQLPTETDICAVFDVSVIVAKNAYDELVKEGLIHRIKGKGSFVTTKKTYLVPLKEFFNIAHFSPSFKYEMQKRLIFFDSIKYESSIHDVFKLNVDELCYVSKLVIYLKKEPVIYQIMYLPKKYFLNLNIDILETHTALDIIEKHSSLNIKTVQNVFKPHNLESHEAQLLKLTKNDPAHFVKSYLINEHQEICAEIISIYPGKTTHFEVNLI